MLVGYRGKLKPDDAEFLAERLRVVMAGFPNARAEYAAAGLSEKRFRWDLLHSARRLDPQEFNRVMDSVYSYADDENIDTLLRWVVG